VIGVRHAVRRTRLDETGAAVEPPPGMVTIQERTVAPGQAFAMTGGEVYLVGRAGQLRRLNKPHKSKKERRARRATVKAVRAARAAEGGP
jgi:hypothetical protein